MTEEFPARSYRDHVLADCFEDAKRLFLEHYLDVDRAHAVMLGDQGIITSGELSAILSAIDGLDLAAIRDASYDGSVEDLFYYLQQAIAARSGDADIAGRLHTARSRNDIDVTIYRLHLREATLALLASCMDLRSVLLDLAGRHHEALMPAYTHTQPAQPTTVAHFLLALAENTARDIRRLRRAFDNLNRCPLGACAITTTGFPIDRRRVSELLGFDEPTRNSYASIASTDYFTELVGATATALINVGRYAQEFLLMAMTEFDAIRLPDGYVQASSIMPQKRNPVAMEHVRAIASKAHGQALGVLASVHNTPFGDINDVEDDLQPLIHDTLRDANRAVSLLAATLESAEFRLDVLRRRAEENFITVTELADTLVRREGMPFSVAHAVVGRAVRAAADGGGRITHAELRAAAKDVIGREPVLTEAELETAISAENFVNVRSVYGGPAPAETREALRAEREAEARDRAWLTDVTNRLGRAAAGLAEAVTKGKGGAR